MINISELDNQVEEEWKYEYYFHDYILSLLETSTFEGRLKDQMENEINDIPNMSKDRYDKIVFQLFVNQLDRISSGLSYNATDILKHLKKLM